MLEKNENKPKEAWIGPFILIVSNSSPSLEDPGSRLRHAVDAPVCVPVLVADGDREPAVVGPYDLNRLARVAEDGDGITLTSIGRLVFGPVRCLT